MIYSAFYLNYILEVSNMKSKRFIVWLLVLALSLSLVGCTHTPVETSAPTEPTETENLNTINGSFLYTQATAKAESLKTLVMTITTEKTTAVGNESLTENSEQTLSCSGLHTDAMTASMAETLTIGGQKLEISECFAEDTGYITIEDNCFSGEFSAEEFCARFAPAVLFDTDLYESVLAENTDKGTTITFTQPTAVESWIAPEDAELISANGTAELSLDGDLLESTYDVTYSYGPAVIRETVTVKLDTDTVPVIGIPENAEEYIPLDFPDAPRMVKTVAGYLLQSSAVTSSSAENILSQAGSVTRSESVQLDMYGSTAVKRMAEIETSITLVDYTRNGETSSFQQTEHFQNGVYTVSVNGGEPEEHSTITASVVQTYCQSLLLNSPLALEYIENAVLTDLESTYLVQFTGKEALAKLLCGTACLTLFNDDNLLNNLATDYSTDTMECYLAIDKYTGFPTATGYEYSGTHTIEGIPYILSVQQDQSFYLSSLTSYETITGEAPKDSQTYEDPTPLLYRVTGEDGQQMYLFGTIHIGDGRTSRLPQYVNDAFDSADALAVEFNTELFEELAESDEDLQASIAEYYFYLDGTQFTDHLDEELAELTVKLLKASGNYSQNTRYLKPSFIESSLQSFYTRQGYHLTSKHGMDTRLMQRASAAGKEILEVESGLSQIKMLADFPEALQQMLLESTVCADPLEYIASLDELYTMWCEGDEAALRSAIFDDPTEPDESELSKEELELYEIYNKAISTDRNAAMVETAKGYMTSGKTVFFAVGLAHLLSPEDGLVDALRAAGYTVELVSASANS